MAPRSWILQKFKAFLVAYTMLTTKNPLTSPQVRGVVQKTINLPISVPTYECVSVTPAPSSQSSASSRQQPLALTDGFVKAYQDRYIEDCEKNGLYNAAADYAGFYIGLRLLTKTGKEVAAEVELQDRPVACRQLAMYVMNLLAQCQVQAVHDLEKADALKKLSPGAPADTMNYLGGGMGLVLVKGLYVNEEQPRGEFGRGVLIIAPTAAKLPPSSRNKASQLQHRMSGLLSRRGIAISFQDWPMLHKQLPRIGKHKFTANMIAIEPQHYDHFTRQIMRLANPRLENNEALEIELRTYYTMGKAFSDDQLKRMGEKFSLDQVEKMGIVLSESERRKVAFLNKRPGETTSSPYLSPAEIRRGTASTRTEEM